MRLTSLLHWEEGKKLINIFSPDGFPGAECVVTRPSPVDVQRRLAYSLAEAAGALSVSTTTLQRAISHGLIHFTKIGSAIRLPVDEIERLAREGLPKMPAGYKRKTAGPQSRGRPKTKRRG